MNQIDKNQLFKALAVLLLLIGAVGVATHLRQKNSITLEEYAKQNGQPLQTESISASDISAGNPAESDSVSQNDAINSASKPSLVGELLNGGAEGTDMLSERVTLQASDGSLIEDFYAEPLSDNLFRFMQGNSFPDSTDCDALAITPEELYYLHILHYDFEGNVIPGELICNRLIATDLLDIFYELYRNEYQIEQVKLIDEFDGDDTASMEANNTSCFNYRVVEGSTNLSKHAYGLAIDINPLYNPYITYNKDGTQKVSPEAALEYADRTQSFPYKIDETDLCYKLFIRHGFTWGGNWNSVKDYQHFQKAK